MQFRLRLLASCIMAMMLFAPAPMQVAQKRHPNVIIILADDLGYGDVGCFNPKSKIPTPNIDRLAKEGMRFTDAHSPSAVCTPTRYALLTGRYSWRSRLQQGVLGPFGAPLIDAKQLTIAGMLQQRGYTTACIGKWHLGWDWPKVENGKRDFSQPARNGPTARGFNSYFGTDVPNYPPYCFIENDRTVGIPSVMAPVPRDGFNRPGPMLPGWQLVDVLPSLADRAVRFVETAAKSDKPFFLYLPLTSPHYPVVPSPQFKSKSGAGDFGDFVVQTNDVVGRVLEALTRAKAVDDTLVIFTSDNGPEITNEVKPGVYDRLKQYGHASMGDWRGAKRDLWEAGHRVPFVVRWPGRIKADSTSAETICHVDLMSTLAAILDATLPDNAGVDSFNLLPALRGEKRDEPIRPATVHHSGGGRFAIRKGDWVLIVAPTGSGNGPRSEPDWFRAERGYQAHSEPGELYDLKNDPAQLRNRYSAEPAKVQELTATLESIVLNGRSTPGPKQKNDVDVQWRTGPPVKR